VLDINATRIAFDSAAHLRRVAKGRPTSTDSDQNIPGEEMVIRGLRVAIRLSRFPR